MASAYTIIKPVNDGPVPAGLIAVLRESAAVGTRIDMEKYRGVDKKHSGKVGSLAIKTKLLKKAILEDDAVYNALRDRENPVELTDIVPVRSFGLSTRGVRVALPMAGSVYARTVHSHEETAHFPDHETLGSAKRRLESLAQLIPLIVLTSLVGGIIYMGVRVKRITTKMVQDQADENKTMINASLHNDQRTFDNIVRKKGGFEPAEPTSQSTNFQAAEHKRAATSPATKQKAPPHR